MARADLSRFTMGRTESIRRAMEKITENKARAVVVLDGGRVVGVVSDGDIRRAFLRDVLPMAPVEKIMQVDCRMTTETDPARQAAALHDMKVTVLPVVNAANELIDVVVGTEPFFDESPPHG